jgi:putative FmdB family regulatory protein
MPMIDYECLDCNKKYEVFYKTQQERVEMEAQEKCPNCLSTNKQKQVSTGTSFELKGNRWAAKGKGGY